MLETAVIVYNNPIMTRLALSLLGTCQVTLEGEPITAFESDKVRALLFFLAIESDRPHRRETLAALFWPERPERNAIMPKPARATAPKSRLWRP